MTGTIAPPRYDLSVIIPGPIHAGHLIEALPQIHAALTSLLIEYEIMVADSQANEETQQLIKAHRAKWIAPRGDGYGFAFRAGFERASGDYIIVMDADQARPADFLSAIWEARDMADVIVASRYVPGGQAIMPGVRRFLSKTLNVVFSRGLDLRMRDMSSGFRLYKKNVAEELRLECENYDVLQESLIKALMEGYRIYEIPFTFCPRGKESYFSMAFRFGWTYLKTFWQLWKLRNSIANADYDARAYNAMMPPQRYWQRQRYKHVTKLLENKGKCLDVGCGSSRIIEMLPPGSVALDILRRKLRYDRRYACSRVQASIFELPIKSESFPSVICSQVIEHVSKERALDELDRVLQPGGFLILGTPDYSKWQWLLIEWLYKILLPQAYADEHITHYSYRELYDEFVCKRGYRLDATRYILQGELILGLRKPPL